MSLTGNTMSVTCSSCCSQWIWAYISRWLL